MAILHILRKILIWDFGVFFHCNDMKHSIIRVPIVCQWEAGRESMVISIASQKGGVGKTSTAISLSAGVARLG